MCGVHPGFGELMVVKSPLSVKTNPTLRLLRFHQQGTKHERLPRRGTKADVMRPVSACHDLYQTSVMRESRTAFFKWFLHYLLFPLTVRNQSAHLTSPFCHAEFAQVDLCGLELKFIRSRHPASDCFILRGPPTPYPTLAVLPHIGHDKQWDPLPP